MDASYHIPIMLEQVVNLLEPERGGVFVDGTLGGGGHARALLERLPAGSRLFGIDRDTDALSAAGRKLTQFGDSFTPIHGNFFHMRELLKAYGVLRIDGALLDLGVSSYQLDTPERGFSYHDDAPLDMRMDLSAQFNAYGVINGYEERELAAIIRDYGEERFAGRIARAVARERNKRPIQSTCELAQIIKAAIPAANRREGPHPARRTFQAVRIEVNGELKGLGEAVTDAARLLSPGGVLAVITFHSLEDRIVKQAFRTMENPCICSPKAPVCVCGRKSEARVLTKKPLTATERELRDNPRSRSAKLRAIRRNAD